MSVGGDGKTPHTEYLIQLLQQKLPLATLSRGYKRETRGFILAGNQSVQNARTLGDEPFLYFLKYKNIFVSVGENRVNAVIALLNQVPFLKCIILDDAFQHRAIHAGLSIIVSDFAMPFFEDEIIPLGRLRESSKGASRADIIIISKCKNDLTENERDIIIQKINPKPSQGVYFTSFEYDSLYQFLNPDNRIKFTDIAACYFFSGIAKPENAILFLQQQQINVVSKIFPDHYFFTESDMEAVFTDFNNIQSSRKCIITTEKDATRLIEFSAYFQAKNIEIYILPIRVKFLFDKGEEFNLLIKKYLGLPLFEEEWNNLNWS